MAELKRSKALVLKKSKLGEADLRVEALFEEGTVFALRVHGIRKSKKRGPLLWTPGNTLEIVYYPKEASLYSVKEAVLLKDRIPSKASWRYLKELHLFIDIFIKFHRTATSEPQLFLLADGGLDVFFEMERDYSQKNTYSSATQKSMSLLQEKRQRDFHAAGQNLALPKQRLLSVFLKIRLFRLAGLLGDPKHCTNCDRILKMNAFFQFPELSFLCRECAQKQGCEASPDDFLKARILAMLSRFRFGRLQREGLSGLGGDNLEDLSLAEQIRRPPLEAVFRNLEEQIQRLFKEEIGNRK